MKTKTLKDKNGNPIQIEQSQVRGLKEALANAGGGASGKEVVIADNNLYSTIYNTNLTDEDNLYLDFSKFDFDNKYIEINLDNYHQDMERNQMIFCDLMNKTIKNATIIIYMPFVANKEVTDKVLQIFTKDSGLLLFDSATQQVIGNTFSIDFYTSLKYEDGMDFGFGISSNLGDYIVKIDFDENGFANCIMRMNMEL